MLSTKGSDIYGSIDTVAVYKGLVVAVYTVDKTEVNLTRQDLIDLINVCSVFIIIISNLENITHSPSVSGCWVKMSL